MITKVIQEAKIQEASAHISKGQRFAILTHVSPDGDALGSSLALYHFLLSQGKESVSVIVPNHFADYFDWMPGADKIIVYTKEKQLADRMINTADVIFCLDFNSLNRIEKVAPTLLEAGGTKIMIDHHLYPGDFCSIVMSHPEISATCELIFRFICRMGMFSEMDKDIATCIYTGMMTDTGSFAYNSNHPEIYTIVSELIQKGINKDWIYSQINQVYSESRQRMMGYVLYEKMKIYPEKKASLITLSQEELARFDYQPGDTEGFVNMPLDIKNISFSVFLRENNEYVKVSLRSIGDLPCNTFAAKYFNGGGHKNASGGEVYGTMEEAIALFEKGLEEFDFDQ